MWVASEFVQGVHHIIHSSFLLFAHYVSVFVTLNCLLNCFLKQLNLLL